MTEGTHGGRRKGSGAKPGPKPGTASETSRKFLEARAAKEAALARLRQAEADEQERHLFRASEVEQAVTTAHAAVAQRLLNLPDILERRHGLEPDLLADIESSIHEIMNALADDLQALAPDLQT